MSILKCTVNMRHCIENSIQKLTINFRTVCTVWQSLGKDKINLDIINSLIDLITNTPLYDTSSKPFLNKPVASLIPIAVS